MRKEIIAQLINEQWSPEQIRGWMLCKGKECVCVEPIYSYIRFDRTVEENFGNIEYIISQGKRCAFAL
ncbi:MAG: hypothetical protein MR536_02285 [Prevotella sp.]|nr:hypothetical protein [Prevotella sp.]MDD7461502.1 hypothetical protein [Prevotellaceae bacterium]MDY3365077.1 hypothetical protein [Prevotella sp.]MDY3853075.1 hypothetical protein [Prevotella sp.]